SPSTPDAFRTWMGTCFTAVFLVSGRLELTDADGEGEGLWLTVGAGEAAWSVRPAPDPKAWPMRRTPMTTAATRMIPRIVDVAMDISDPHSLAGPYSPPPSVLPPRPTPGHRPGTEPDPPPPLAEPEEAPDQHWIVLQRS